MRQSASINDTEWAHTDSADLHAVASFFKMFEAQSRPYRVGGTGGLHTRSRWNMSNGGRQKPSLPAQPKCVTDVGSPGPEETSFQRQYRPCGHNRQPRQATFRHFLPQLL